MERRVPRRLVPEDLFSAFRRFVGSNRLALKIALIYTVLGLAWVQIEHKVLSGSLVFKDTFYIFGTAWLLFWLVDHGVATIRKKEKEVRESEARLSSILDANPCGVVLVDAKGFLAYANKEAGRIFGAERDELVGRRYAGLPLEAADGGRLFHVNESPGAPIPGREEPIGEVECLVRQAAGDRLVLSVNSAPLRDAGGGDAGMVCTFLDVTGRRRAQELTMRKLSLAVEQSPIAVMITDVTSVVEYVNPRYTEMTGYWPVEILGMRLTTGCDLPPKVCEEVCKIVGSGGGWKGECESRKRDGSPFWETVSVAPIRDPEGEITHFLWVREDISDHRRADEALRESRKKFQDLVETIGDLVWEIDRDLVATYVGPRVREILGYEPGEVVGRAAFDFVPRFESHRLAAVFGENAAKRVPFNQVESIVRRKDGRYLILESSGVPYFAEDGSFLGYRGVSRDVSERKRVEEALRESEERFRQIFEQNEEPVMLFRAGSAEVVDANPAAIALYGYDLEELKAHGPTLFTEPGERKELLQKLLEVRPGDRFTIDKSTHVRKDRMRLIVSIRGRSIRLQTGPVSYVTFRDITARLRMEEEARAQQAALVHANRMVSLGTIVSGVAHEVNNPNNLIMFNAPMVRSAWEDVRPVLDGYAREHGDFPVAGLPYTEMRTIVPKLVNGVTDASRRIKNIVSNLKDFARKSGSDQYECVIDLNAVVGSAAAILNHEIIKGCRNFRIDLEAGLPKVRGCAQHLEQVVINLLMNALEALPEPGRGIFVSTASLPDAGTVEIRVRDEGSGMSAETLQRLAEPFFSTKNESGGLGLGLSISQSIVKEHRGTIAFDSVAGRGTTVTVTIPALPESRGPGPDAPSARVS